MNLAKQIGESLAPVVDLLYPPRCPLCGEALGQQGGLCVDCWSQLEMPDENNCPSCQGPMNTELEEEQVCETCLADTPLHDGIAAATLYNPASRKLILAYKHGRKIALAPMLARLMASRLGQYNTDETAPLLVPVPLHPFRLWRRGFNQAALLARELAKLGKGELLVDGLVRRKMTRSLGGLGRYEREQTLSGAIKAGRRRVAAIEGRDVILVDDVLTSGATSNACTRALIEAGASSVRIACFARVAGHSVEHF